MKNERREISFNKNNNENLFFKHLENNSNNFGLKPNYLQYDFEQIKLINKKNFMNIINNKSNKSKENDKNNIFKENSNLNLNNNINNKK